MVELFYAEDDANIAGVVKEYLEQKNFKEVYAFQDMQRSTIEIRFVNSFQLNHHICHYFSLLDVHFVKNVTHLRNFFTL